MIDIASDLDLYQEESVDITKRIKDLTQITPSETEFSREFSVPATKKNNDVFGYYANIDVDSVISPHKSIPAYWTIDLSTRFTGVIEIKGCAYRDGYPASYNIVFYGRVKNLASIFGEDRLVDLPEWSTLDHLLSSSNVLGSWMGICLMVTFFTH